MTVKLTVYGVSLKLRKGSVVSATVVVEWKPRKQLIADKDRDEIVFYNGMATLDTGKLTEIIRKTANSKEWLPEEYAETIHKIVSEELQINANVEVEFINTWENTKIVVTV